MRHTLRCTVILSLLFSATFLAPARAADPVDLLLVLAADVSRSVDSAKFKLQREGYAAAISNGRVLDAIASGRTHRIAVLFLEWSGNGNQKVVIDWTVVDGPKAAQAFADQLLELPRAFADRTSISGGIDSAIIVTLAQEQMQAAGLGRLKTFTLGFDSLNEFAEAREVADRLGTDHHEITITKGDFIDALPDIAWSFDEPVANPSAPSLYFVSRAAREHVSVVLSGEGADELFGGYRVYLEPFAVDRVRRLPRPVRALAARLGRSEVAFPGVNYLRRASTALEDRYFGGGYGTFAPEEVRRLLRSATIQPHVRPGRALAMATPGFTDLPESRRMQLIDMHGWLPGDILTKADRMSMAHSLELRVPFLDLDVANVSARVPDSLKYRDGTTKWILRRAFRGRLPASTERRRKLGFPTPLRQWLTRHPDALLAPIRQSTFLGEIIDLTYVEELAERHAAGRIDASRRLLLLLMLAGWLDAFMDGDPIVPPSQRTQQAAADPVVEHLDLRSDYLRTEPSQTDERSEDPRPGVVNNFASRTAGATPRWIVQHYTYDDYDASLKLYLADGGTSAHYLVPAEAPFVQLLVAPEHRAHQAGSGALLPSSALNPYVGGGGLTEDMNSWSYGVENVS
ncbi:MAG: asparagine synthase-related protein, partial [Planctomycetota bacterium]